MTGSISLETLFSSNDSGGRGGNRSANNKDGSNHNNDNDDDDKETLDVKSFLRGAFSNPNDDRTTTQNGDSPSSTSESSSTPLTSSATGSAAPPLDVDTLRSMARSNGAADADGNGRSETSTSVESVFNNESVTLTRAKRTFDAHRGNPSTSAAEAFDGRDTFFVGGRSVWEVHVCPCRSAHLRRVQSLSIR